MLLHLIAPHITEEVWEIIGNKGYLSLTPWIRYDEKVLTEENKFKWNLMNNIIGDINNIKNLIKKEFLEKISLIIADKWKYHLYSKLFNLIDKTMDQGEIMKQLMKESELKLYGKFVSQIVNRILKNIGKYSKYSLTSADEFAFFKDIKTIIEKKYNTVVTS